MADEERDPAVGAVGTDPGDGPEPGGSLVNATFVGTGALVVSSVAAAADPETFGAVHAALSIGLFVVGTAAMLWAYALGVSRSRTELVTVPGLFFLAGEVAPRATRRALRIATAVEIVAVVVAASIRPYSEVAFGILAPMFGLGMMGVWGGRHGVFPAAPTEVGRVGPMLIADLTPPLPIVLLLIEFPVVMALLDCWQRPEEHFADGAADRKAWIRWLIVAVITVPILIGFGIVLGYYYAVVRRNSPASRP